MPAELSDVVPSTAKSSDAAAPSIDLTEPFVLGDWRIEPALRRASKGDTVVKIDPRNLRVLQILAERQGTLVSTREIEALAWEGVVVTPDSLYQSIRQLRQALRDTKSPAKYIETVPRRGYRLVADVLACGSREVVRAESEASIKPYQHRVDAGEPRSSSDFVRLRPIAIKTIVSSSIIALLGLVWVAGRDRSEMTKVINGQGPSEQSSTVARFSSAQFLAQVDASKMDAQSLRDMGRVTRQQGRMSEALTFYKQALKGQIAATGESNELTGELYAETANLLFTLDDEVAARNEALKAVSILTDLAPASPSRALTLGLLAEILVGSGDYEEAERLLDAASSLASQHYGVGHISTAHLLRTRAVLWLAQEKLLEAEKAAGEVLAIQLRAKGPNDAITADARTLVSTVMMERGLVPQAEQEARLAVDILRRIEDDSQYLWSAKHVLAESLVKQGSLVEAEALLREELDALLRRKAVDWRVARAAGALAETLLHKGQLAEAEHYLALCKAKLPRENGWPIEREHRKMDQRRQMLSSLRSNTIKLTKL